MASRRAANLAKQRGMQSVHVFAHTTTLASGSWWTRRDYEWATRNSMI
jgi:hypothetical protein